MIYNSEKALNEYEKGKKNTKVDERQESYSLLDDGIGVLLWSQPWWR